MTLTEAARRRTELQSEIDATQKTFDATMTRLKRELSEAAAVLVMKSTGIDHDKVSLAEGILDITDYDTGGDERASCVSDAIKQFALGAGLGPYTDLWRQYFGTKSYDRWHGQRVNCEYGMGPKHGSVIFRIGITRAALKRKQSDLTSEEVEACIYYLTNLRSIQLARQQTKAA